MVSVDFLQPELEMPDSNSAEKQRLQVDPPSGIPGLSEPSAHPQPALRSARTGSIADLTADVTNSA